MYALDLCTFAQNFFGYQTIVRQLHLLVMWFCLGMTMDLEDTHIYVNPVFV